MRCAILKLASEPPIGLVRLLSLAMQETTDRRLSDHPPPTASSTRAQNEMPAWGALRGCAEERVLARLDKGENPGEDRGIRRGAEPKGTGDGEVPSFLAAAGARGTQTSAGRREEVGRIGRVWIRVAIVVDEVPRDQEARLFQDSGQVDPVIGGRMNHGLDCGE